MNIPAFIDTNIGFVCLAPGAYPREWDLNECQVCGHLDEIGEDSGVRATDPDEEHSLCKPCADRYEPGWNRYMGPSHAQMDLALSRFRELTRRVDSRLLT